MDTDDDDEDDDNDDDDDDESSHARIRADITGLMLRRNHPLLFGANLRRLAISLQPKIIVIEFKLCRSSCGFCRLHHSR